MMRWVASFPPSCVRNSYFSLPLPDKQNPDSASRRILYGPIAGPSRIDDAIRRRHQKRNQAKESADLSVFDPGVAPLTVAIEARIKILPAYRFRSVAFPAEIFNQRIWIKRT